MHDSLLDLYTNTPPITAAGATTGAAKMLGRNRSFYAVGRVGGDVTGAGATLSFTIEQSANGTSGWAQIAGPASLTEMVGFVGGTTPRPEVPGLQPVKLAFNTTQDFVRTVLTAAGTTPAFPQTSVKVEPIIGAAFKPSGG